MKNKIFVFFSIFLLLFVTFSNNFVGLSIKENENKNGEKVYDDLCLDENLTISLESIEYIGHQMTNNKDFSVYEIKYIIGNPGDKWFVGRPATTLRRADSEWLIEVWDEKNIIYSPGMDRSLSHRVFVESSIEKEEDKERYVAGCDVVIEISPSYNKNKRDYGFLTYWNDEEDYIPTEPHLIVSTPWKYDFGSIEDLANLSQSQLFDFSKLPDVLKKERLGYITHLHYCMYNITSEIISIVKEEDPVFIQDASIHLNEILQWISQVSACFEKIVLNLGCDDAILTSKLLNFELIKNSHILPLSTISNIHYSEVISQVENITNEANGFNEYIKTKPWENPIRIKGIVENVRLGEVITITCRNNVKTFRDDFDGEVDGKVFFDFIVSSEPINSEQDYITPKGCTVTIEGDQHSKVLTTNTLLSYCFSDGTYNAKIQEITNETKSFNLKSRLANLKTKILEFFEERPLLDFVKNIFKPKSKSHELTNEEIIQQRIALGKEYAQNFDLDDLMSEVITKYKESSRSPDLVFEKYVPNTPKDPNVVYYAEAEIIIAFISSINVNDIYEFKGFYVKDRIPLLNIALISVPGKDLEELIIELEKDPRVRYAELNILRHIDSDPNDPYWNEQWGHKKINCQHAYDIERYMQYAWVTILDTGVDTSHEDLRDKNIFEYDYIEDDLRADDDHGHGTEMTGIILAKTNNNLGIAGVAAQIPNIDHLKVCDYDGDSFTYHITKAMMSTSLYIPSVISMSFSGTSSHLSEAAACLYARTVSKTLLVASVGNGGATDRVNYPAAYSSVIAVGAINQDEELCRYYGDWGSNYNEKKIEVDFVAPGNNTFTTLPGNNYGYIKGKTSAAAAYVSGAIVLWYGREAYEKKLPHVDNDPDKCLKDLRDSSKDLGESGRDVKYGYGLIDAYKLIKPPVSKTKEIKI